MPEIEEKWLAWPRKKVNIQMKNAPAYMKSNKNAQINTKLEETASRGWTINCVLQPPILPGANIKALTLFHVIQSLQYMKLSTNIN